MVPPESVASATVTDLATARRRRKDTAGENDEEECSDNEPTPTRRRVANRRFDAEKVERLKAEIAAGLYKVDPESVADRFIEHERNN